MATRPPTQSPFGQSNAYGGGNANNSVAVGNAAIARMAREDTRWFVVAVIVLSLVLFLALPLSVLIAVDTMKMKAQVRAELREIKQLKRELKEK
mgnify:CR=1 FL=1